MTSKILVALDHGDTCEVVFEQVIEIATAIAAELMLLSVLTAEGDDGITLPSSSGLAYYPISASETIWEMYQKNFEEYEAEGLQRLQRFSAKARSAGLHTEFTQTFGSPDRVICELARTWHADLIVVGSRGRQGFSEMVLGSVSNYVMHHAPCSVLIAKVPKTAEQLVSTSNLTDAEK